MTRARVVLLLGGVLLAVWITERWADRTCQSHGYSAVQCQAWLR